MEAKSFVDYLKLHPKHLIGVGITCFVIVLLPQRWQVCLCYNAIITPYKGWVSLVGVVSLVYGGVICAADYGGAVTRWYTEWQRTRQLAKTLLDLSDEEKQCLAEYFRHNEISRRFSVEDGIANGLCKKGILYDPLGCGYGGQLTLNLAATVVDVVRLRTDIKNEILKHAAEKSKSKPAPSW